MISNYKLVQLYFDYIFHIKWDFIRYLWGQLNFVLKLMGCCVVCSTIKELVERKVFRFGHVTIYVYE